MKRGHGWIAYYRRVHDAENRVLRDGRPRHHLRDGSRGAQGRECRVPEIPQQPDHRHLLHGRQQEERGEEGCGEIIPGRREDCRG